MTNETGIDQRHVPALLGVCLAIAATTMLWIDKTLLHWITTETTPLVGGAVSAALWALVIANLYFGIDASLTAGVATSAAQALMGVAP